MGFTGSLTLYITIWLANFSPGIPAKNLLHNYEGYDDLLGAFIQKFNNECRNAVLLENRVTFSKAVVSCHLGGYILPNMDSTRDTLLVKEFLKTNMQEVKSVWIKNPQDSCNCFTATYIPFDVKLEFDDEDCELPDDLHHAMCIKNNTAVQVHPKPLC